MYITVRKIESKGEVAVCVNSTQCSDNLEQWDGEGDGRGLEGTGRMETCG